MSCPTRLVEQEHKKYSYTFSLMAAKTSEEEAEPERTEVQSYINELLGLEPKKSDKNKIAA